MKAAARWVGRAIFCVGLTFGLLWLGLFALMLGIVLLAGYALSEAPRGYGP